MRIDEKQIFNLWDTNGRRSDILNALSIYLTILNDLELENPGVKWGSYPDSLAQFHFYNKAVQASPEVFSQHKKYDIFLSEIKPLYNSFIKKEPSFFEKENSSKLLKILDESIEQRARHYTSNLVRIGLASKNRKITSSGMAFLNEIINRDDFEKILPINNMNILLLRQLMKLRIFSKCENNSCKYYSPFYMAMYLLLTNDRIDKSSFINIIQATTPYLSDEIKGRLLDNNLNFEEKEILATYINFETPEVFKEDKLISEDIFSSIIKNRKSGETEKIYYSFYKTLYEFVENNNEALYSNLKEVYQNNKEKIKKAFCRGKTIFDFGTNGVFNLNTFIAKNSKNPFLNQEHFNLFFYKMYEESKYIDQVAEYSDTTIRMLGATGLIKTKSPLYELSYKTVLKNFFDIDSLKQCIFGEVSEEEYENYEIIEDSYLGSIKSMTEIFKVDNYTVDNKMQELLFEYNVNNTEELTAILDNEVNFKFNEYIEKNYPVERVAKLLNLFSDRKNDRIIKAEVNESADIPTIYEYIVGIAWYYISNRNFNLYDSLNLTLNADFEPEMHAGGGMGDIVIDYDDKSIMIEVTLMNKSAQKRGEWEPVLRHSINNKVDKMPRKAYTFFIADELDFNTINIWRAVAAVPLQSTLNNVTTEGVIIMPFTNQELISFMNSGIDSEKIIHETDISYSLINKITDDEWRKNILNNL